MLNLVASKLAPKINLLIVNQQKPDMLYPADIHQYKTIVLMILAPGKLQDVKPAVIKSPSCLVILRWRWQ